MTEQITPLAPNHRGSFLGTVSVYRSPDGSIAAVLNDMAAHEIEGKETMPERFNLVAEWLRAGADDLEAQGKEFSND